MKPLVAIVGRPNVGKSTLFNKLVGDRISIVEDEPGVTRDRVQADCEWCGRVFTLIDTGGLELKSDDEMWTHIREQVEIAVSAADAIVYVVDGRTGLTLDDEAIASYLRKAKVPFLFIHGEDDVFVPCWMTEEIYKNCASPKTKLIVKGAGHGESYYKDTEGYERAMDSFIGGIIK